MVNNMWRRKRGPPWRPRTPRSASSLPSPWPLRVVHTTVTAAMESPGRMAVSAAAPRTAGPPLTSDLTMVIPRPSSLHYARGRKTMRNKVRETNHRGVGVLATLHHEDAGHGTSRTCPQRRKCWTRVHPRILVPLVCRDVPRVNYLESSP